MNKTWQNEDFSKKANFDFFSLKESRASENPLVDGKYEGVIYFNAYEDNYIDGELNLLSKGLFKTEEMNSVAEVFEYVKDRLGVSADVEAWSFYDENANFDIIITDTVAINKNSSEIKGRNGKPLYQFRPATTKELREWERGNINLYSVTAMMRITQQKILSFEEIEELY